MKTLLITTLALVSTSAASMAKDLTILYPEKACSEILSQEYSTGGGDKVIQSVEFLCKSADGKYVGYVVDFGSVGGLFGIGRFTMPDRIVYVPYDGVTAKKK